MPLLRFSDLRYEPDKTKLWDAHPGTVYEMTNFVPYPDGTYSTFGSVAWGGYGTLAGTAAPIIAYMMPLLDGTSRLLVGTAANIDEYSSVAVRTNRGTGYTATTWSMAQYGNQTIATNYTNVVQAATGAASAFAALGGTPPRALIAVVQSNFVLLFNVTDGATTYEDGWQCSGIGNSASWTTVGGAANLATQANNGRLLQAPGPIRAAVAFRDVVVAFKDNAIFVGQYSGNPFGFSWRMVSSQVGAHSMQGIVEHRGKLYFFHTSGFYTFDGAALQNIGDGSVNNSAYADLGYGLSASAISDTNATADDVLCNVFFLGRRSGQNYRTRAKVFNSLSGKWGEVGFLVGSEAASNNDATLVKATTYQIVNFKTTAPGRVMWFKWINSGTLLTLHMGAENNITGADASVMRLSFGSRDRAKHIKSAYLDYGQTLGTTVPVDPAGSLTLTITGGQSPAQLANINSGATFTYNSSTLTHDGLCSGKFFRVELSTTAAAHLDAISLEIDGTGKQ